MCCLIFRLLNNRDVLQDEERLKEVVRYKTEQLKLLVIGFISTFGGCMAFLVNLETVIDFGLTLCGLAFCSVFLYSGYLKHRQIKKLLR